MKDNRIILFDGSNLDMWREKKTGEAANWIIEHDRMTVNHGHIVSTVEFGDAQIHVEFRCPDMPEATGQDKGNSGVFVHGCYELQVLDSYGIEDCKSYDCGGVYCIYEPLFNACLPALEWQTYDIFVRAARLNGDGTVKEYARLTVIHNGICIHNSVEVKKPTGLGVYDRIVERGPLMLQDHKNKVSYRNIWVRPLD